MRRWEHLSFDSCGNFIRLTSILYWTSKIHSSRWTCGSFQQKIRSQIKIVFTLQKMLIISLFQFWERFFSIIKKLGIYDRTSKFLLFFAFSILIVAQPIHGYLLHHINYEAHWVPWLKNFRELVERFDQML